MDNEEWRDIPNYEGYYQVSNLGGVRGLDRVVYRKSGVLVRRAQKKLSQTTSRNGYKQVCLAKDGEKKLPTVHSLVAMAFLNHIPCGHDKVVNHKNFDRTDNRVENLEIITVRENANQKHLKSSSQYVGVYWNKKDKKWMARIYVNRKSKHLGCFKEEIDAHKAYQTALEEINSGKQISFKSKEKSSKYKWVYWSEKAKKWVSSVYIHGKIKYLGSFLSEEDAYIARQKELSVIENCLLSL